jgi:HlyD family secretion protein
MKKLPYLSKRNLAIAGSVALILAATALVSATRAGVPDLPIADVTSGPYIDVIEIRGEIRPFRSVIVTAPSDAGQLTIVRIARDGTHVKAGDVIVEFDPSTPQRELMARMTELKQALAQVEQVRAQARITAEARATGLMKAEYDVQRAELDLSGQEFLPRIEVEKFKLLLDDAKQRLAETKSRVAADAQAAEQNIATALRRVERVQVEIDRRKTVLENLQMKAPADGVVSVMLNFRTGGPGQMPQEFRPGDQAWPNAPLIELPDLSSVHLLTRVEESDRGRMQNGQRASIRIDALPGSDLQATLTNISMLARPDFSTGFPPGRNFEMKISVDKPDDRLRPGMSATARVAVGRIENAVLVPAGAVFSVDGQQVVYKLDGRTFTKVAIQVLRRGREHVAVKSGVAPGDKLALTDPTETTQGTAK